MTLIDSYGGPDSNAYISLTEANSFIGSGIPESVLAPTIWGGLNNPQKEAAIMMASIDIDSRQYIGQRFFNDQHLEFPRLVNPHFPLNRTVTAIGSLDVTQKRMKRNVQEACAYQAFQIARDGGRNQHLQNIASGIKGISESVGPIREFVQYGQRTTQSAAKFDSVALSLLQPWMTSRRILRR